MKKLVSIFLLVFLCFSCETADDFDFESSQEIDLGELKGIGDRLVEALKSKNRQDYFRNFDKNLFTSFSSKHVYSDLTSNYNKEQVDYFLEVHFDEVNLSYRDIRKFRLEHVFEEDGKGVVVISGVDEYGFSLMEFTVVNFSNTYKAFDVYFPIIGYKLSDELMVDFEFDWNNLDYSDQSKVVEITNAYLDENHQEVVDVYTTLSDLAKSEPYLQGTYFKSKLALKEGEDIASDLKNATYNMTNLNLDYAFAQEDSSMYATNSKLFAQRYGKGPISKLIESQIYLLYGDRNKGIQLSEEILLEENDLKNVYSNLAYFHCDNGNYKNTMKYIKILSNKFHVTREDIEDYWFKDYDELKQSQEYKAWVASDIIREVPEIE